MKLIRFGTKNHGKPGIVINNQRKDCSAYFSDWNTEFFDNNGLVELTQLNKRYLTAADEKEIRVLMTNNTTDEHAFEKTTQQLLKQKNRTPSQQARLIEDLEVLGKPASAREMTQLPPLPHVPLIMLSEGKDNLWNASMKQLASTVPGSVYQFVPHSKHHIMIDQPTLVIDAVLRALSNSTSFFTD